MKKTISEIRTELFKHIENVQAEYVSKGYLPRAINLNNGIIRGLLEIFIYGIYQLYTYLDYVLKQAVPKTATNEWLDMHAESVNLTRKKATQAEGFVTFTRDEHASGNIKISAGKIVKTKPDGLGKIYRYSVAESAVLQDGEESIAVKVISEDYGKLANATVGQICEILTPIEGIAAVTNSADWLTKEGADDETDAELYKRYVYQWRGVAGVTADAYKASALSVDGVADVYLDDQHPRGQGTIDVYILGTAGLPTQNLLDKVSEKIAGDIIINDDVLVKAPAEKLIDVDIELELLSGTAEEMTSAAEARVRAYFKSLTIGMDVIKDRLAANIISLNGLKKINWNTPAADIEIQAGEIAILNTVAVTVVYAASE